MEEQETSEPEQYPALNKPVKLTDDELHALTIALCDQVDASENAKGRVKARWDSVQHIYACDEQSSTLRLIDGWKPVIRPLYRQKADKISNLVRSAYFSIKPWAQLIDSSGSEPVNDVENTLQAFMEDSNLKTVCRDALLDMVHHNCGVLKCHTTEEGQLDATSVRPYDMMFYPCQVKDQTRCKTIGHRSSLMRWEIDELVRSKVYRKDVDVAKLGLASTAIAQDAIEVHTAATVADDDEIAFWELCTKLKLAGDSKREWIIVCLETESRQILSIERYPYSTPWYFVFKTSTKEKTMFPRDSLGGVFQHLQLNYNDIHTVIFQGSLMAAFPTAFISGGMLTNKVTTYKPGQLIETGDDIKVQYIETRFNPGSLGAESEKIEEIADSLAGTSQLASSENLNPNTSATAVHGLLNADSENKDNYVENVETTFQMLFRYLLELLEVHAPAISARMGPKWEIQPDANVDRRTIDVQPTGGGATTDPRFLTQKLAMLQQMSQDPNSTLDPVKVQRKSIETLDLPFDTDSLMNEPGPNQQPMTNGEKQQQLAAIQQARMGAMVPGVPGMGGDPVAPARQGRPTQPAPANVGGGAVGAPASAGALPR